MNNREEFNNTVKKLIQFSNDAQLYSSTKKLIDNLKPDILKQVHEHFSDIYYNSETDETDENGISDEIFDLLNERFNEIFNSRSVGAKIRTDENRAKLPYWLGSLNKCTPEKPQLLEKLLKGQGKDKFVVSDKLDGVSCLLYHINGATKLFTRGDGIEGADISYFSSRKYFKIPKLTSNIAIRGELIMEKKIFDEKYRETFANPRNLVSGLIGSKTIRPGLDDVKFVAYEIVSENPSTKDNDKQRKPTEQFEILRKLGFEVVPNEIISSLTVDTLKIKLLERKTESIYEIDGLVIQIDKPYTRNKDDNPDYAVAFKMIFEKKKTIVKYVEWNLSAKGQWKPVIIVEPIELEGVTIERATAHHAKYVKDNNLGPGAEVIIVRSNQVIPYILDVVKGANEPQFPDEPYVWDKTNTNICGTATCDAIIYHFFSGIGAKYVGKESIKKLTDKYGNLFNILSSKESEIAEIPGLGKQIANKLKKSMLDALRNAEIPVIIGSSQILGYGVGTRRVVLLFKEFPTILEDYKSFTKKKLIEKINSIHGFGIVYAEKIATNISYVKIFLEKLKKEGYIDSYDYKKKAEVKGDLPFSGKKVLFTGGKIKEISDFMTKNGGEIAGTFNQSIDILIVSGKSTDKKSTKIEKAESFNAKGGLKQIEILTEEQFTEKYMK